MIIRYMLDFTMVIAFFFLIEGTVYIIKGNRKAANFLVIIGSFVFIFCVYARFIL